MAGILIPLQIHGENGKALQNNQITVKTEKVGTEEALKNPLELLSENPSVKEIKEAVVFLAKKYGRGGGNYTILLDVLKCESGFKYNIIGDNGRAYGLAQFHKPTWDYFNKLRGTNLEYKNTAHNLDMFVWAMNNGLESHWSCMRILGYLN